MQTNLRLGRSWAEYFIKYSSRKISKNWQILVKVWIQNCYWNIKKTFDTIQDLEDVLDFIPDEIQEKLEQGSEQAVEWLANAPKKKVKK